MLLWSCVACGHLDDPVADAIPEGTEVVVLSSHSRALPRLWHDPRFLAELRRFVNEGGGLLLRGRAVGLLESLGWAAAVSRSGAYVYGLDGETTGRGYRYGVSLNESAATTLEVLPGPHWLGGGRVTRFDYSLFESADLRDGVAWASFVRDVDGRVSNSQHVALASWRPGAGRVIAHGLAPADSEALDEALLRWLSNGTDDAVVFAPDVVAPDPVIDRWADCREVGDVADSSTPVHVGIRIRGNPLADRGSGPRLDKAIENGVDLVVLQTVGLAESQLAPLSRRLRARGVLVAAVVDDGRELQRLIPQVPHLDGVFVERGVPEVGVAAEITREGGFLVLDTPSPMPGATASVSPVVGRAEGGPVRGTSSPLVDLLPQQLFQVLSVDLTRQSGGYEDWIQRVLRDFARWRPGTSVVFDLPENDAAVALELACKLAADPLRAATTLRASSLGRAGYFDAIARLHPNDVPDPRVASPCAASMLQNRFFRLEGLGGTLLFDTAGAARYGEVTSERFMATTVHGARVRPDGLARITGKLAAVDLSPEAFAERVMRLPDGGYDVKLKSIAQGPGIVEVSLDGAVIDFLAVAEAGTLEHAFRFDATGGSHHRLGFRNVLGPKVQLSSFRYERVDTVGEQVMSSADAGDRVELVERVVSGFHIEERRVATLSSLPGFVFDIRYRRVDDGLRLDRTFAMPRYRVESERPDRIVLTRDGGPTLWVLPLELGERHRLRFEPGTGLTMRCYPRGYEGCRIAVLLADRLPEDVDLSRLHDGCHAVLDAQKPIGEEPSSEPLVVPLPGTQRLLRVEHSDGDEARIRVLRASPLRRRIGVRLPNPVADVRLDGEPWRYRAGREVYLPTRPGVYHLKFGREAVPGPTLVATTAAVEHCSFDADEQTMTVQLASPPNAPESPHTATLHELVVLGVRPVRIEGGSFAASRLDGTWVVRAPVGELRLFFGRAEPAAPRR